MAEKLAELKQKALQKAIDKLEAELNKPDPEFAVVESQAKVIQSKAEALELALKQLGEEYLKAAKEDEYLDVEERQSTVQHTLDAAQRKAYAYLEGPASSSKVNLPQLKLQEFSGDVRQWLKFWASFEELHNNRNVSDAEKFQYLIQCIPPNSTARKCIDSYPVCAKNYQSAIDTLTETFGRDKMLVKVYVRDLLQLVIKNANEKTRVDLLELVPTLSSQIRNLAELGVTTDKCEQVLYPVVESCLPEDVLEAWQRNPSYKETLEDIMKFLNTEVNNKMERSLARMDFAQTPATKMFEKKKGKNTLTPDNSDIPTATGFMASGSGDAPVNRRKQICDFCEKKHKTHQCRTAKLEMTLQERQQVIRQKRLCYSCLRPGHMSSDCKSSIVCSICRGKHYEMMCSKSAQEDSKTSKMGVPVYNQVQPNTQIQGAQGHQHMVEPQRNGGEVYYGGSQQQQQCPSKDNAWNGGSQPTSEPAKRMFSNITARKSVALMTTIVAIETPEGPALCRVFIDEGSEESYVESRVAAAGKCKFVDKQKFPLQKFGGEITEAMSFERYLITLRHANGSNRGTYLFNAIPRIAQKIPKPRPGPLVEAVKMKGIHLIDQSEATEEVQLLIGIDVAAQIWTGGFVRISPAFFARETIFGWVVGGIQEGVPHGDEVNRSHMVTSFMLGNLAEEDLWSLETLGITDESRSQSRDDMEKAALQHFNDTVTRLPDGRYQVGFPWIQGHKKLLSNKSQAIARLNILTKNLKKDGVLKAYHQIMQDWLNEGIIEKVPVNKLSELEYYLPHRHVLKEGSTTPVRPVFDASAKAKGSPSLNDCLEKGPNMLELIPAIMTRFRRFKYGTVADIKKAFLQMSVNEEDRKVLQFLWWTDTTCNEVQVFRHQRVVFGVKSSPFLLAAALKYHLNNNNEYPESSRQLLHSFYVDNSVTSHQTLEEAVDFKEKAQKLLLPAKFDLRGWEIGPSSTDKVVPVLGMNWNTKEEYLSLNADGIMKKMEVAQTKRGIASAMNAVFDPMGFVFPFTITAKLLFQQCCERGLTWDEPLPSDISNAFHKWKEQVPAVLEIKVPRWMCQVEEEKNISLHTFSDASGVAFSACVFIRTESADGSIAVQMVVCRTRVAPCKKKMTIPRLELMGCLIGVRLTNDVKKYLDLQDLVTVYWTDSSTALAWIQNDKTWARFVAGRVDEIRKSTKTEEWRHVPGESNPADLPSRGCTAACLLQRQWWEGPEWLRKPESSWPKSRVQPDEHQVMEEIKKTVTSCHVQKKYDVLDCMMKYSSYHKSLRIVSLVLRYINCLRHRASESKKGQIGKLKLQKPLPRIRESTAEEVNQAEKALLLFIQRTSFSGEDDKQLKDLSVFTDADGLIRTKTQLLFGNEKYDARCPVLLPSKNEMVKALIKAEHETNSHAGTQTTMAIIRSRFWILKGRRTISGVISSCTVCRRFLAKRCEVAGAPLPHDRVKNTVAFDVTGVDLMGPLFLRGQEKVWIVLYTCAVYRCVHLEITNTLSTEGFLRTLRRFIARRGRPSKLYSDNGLNFVGCNNLFSQLDFEEVRRYAAVQRMEWVFNPPTAAWWGGFWERLVGLTKRLLRRILGKSVVDMEELSTILCDVEATLNRRPLTYISEKDGELEPLCPEMFMKDNPASGIPEADVIDAESLRVRAKKCQQLREELRSRFRTEYLGQLKHISNSRNITAIPGDVVIIEMDDKKRVDWPLGVIKEMYPGRDGSFRTALVKTKCGEFLRPLQRLFLLETSEKPTPRNEKAEKEAPDNPVLATRYGRRIVKPDRLVLYN